MATAGLFKKQQTQIEDQQLPQSPTSTTTDVVFLSERRAAKEQLRFPISYDDDEEAFFSYDDDSDDEYEAEDEGPFDELDADFSEELLGLEFIEVNVPEVECIEI